MHTLVVDRGGEVMLEIGLLVTVRTQKVYSKGNKTSRVILLHPPSPSPKETERDQGVRQVMYSV